MDKLLIIGAGGHGKVVANIALKMGTWKGIVFLDDKDQINSSLGFDVIGSSKDALNYINDFDIFIAIGNNHIREEFHQKLKTAGANIPTLIHPSVIIGSSVEIGEGTVIMAGTVINCCSRIGYGCIINTGSTIDHDNIIEDYVHVSPGAHLAGTVSIGKYSWIGVGAVVSNNIRISENIIVGAGSVVIKDLEESGTYIGAPARRIGSEN